MDVNVPVFVINLDRSPERLEPWSRFEDVHRISAVDGSKLDVANDARISIRTKNLVMKTGDRLDHFDINSRGAIGCYLSHVNACQMIVDRRIPIAIVCEDDLSVQKIPGRYTKLADYIFEHLGPKELGDLTVINPNPWFTSYDPFKFVGTHCVIWTEEGAQKFLSMCFPIEGHVDHVLSTLSELGFMDIRPAFIKGLKQNIAKFGSTISHNSVKCVTRTGTLFYVVIALCIVVVATMFVIRKNSKFLCGST